MHCSATKIDDLTGCYLVVVAGIGFLILGTWDTTGDDLSVDDLTGVVGSLTGISKLRKLKSKLR